MNTPRYNFGKKIIFAVVLFINSTANAAELTNAQLRWAACSWKTFESYGLEELQKKIVFGKSATLADVDYKQWEDFDVRMVDPACGDSLKLFADSPGKRFTALRSAHRDQKR